MGGDQALPLHFLSLWKVDLGNMEVVPRLGCEADPMTLAIQRVMHDLVQLLDYLDNHYYVVLSSMCAPWTWEFWWVLRLVLSA